MGKLVFVAANLVFSLSLLSLGFGHVTQTLSIRAWQLLVVYERESSSMTSVTLAKDDLYVLAT